MHSNCGLNDRVITSLTGRIRSRTNLQSLHRCAVAFVAVSDQKFSFNSTSPSKQRWARLRRSVPPPARATVPRSIGVWHFGQFNASRPPFSGYPPCRPWSLISVSPARGGVNPSYSQSYVNPWELGATQNNASPAGAFASLLNVVIQIIADRGCSRPVLANRFAISQTPHSTAQHRWHKVGPACRAVTGHSGGDNRMPRSRCRIRADWAATRARLELLQIANCKFQNAN